MYICTGTLAYQCTSNSNTLLAHNCPLEHLFIAIDNNEAVNIDDNLPHINLGLILTRPLVVTRLIDR